MSEQRRLSRQELLRRRKLVRRIRCVFFGVLVLLILIPTIICICSRAKIKRLEKTIEELNALVDSQTYEQYELQEQIEDIAQNESGEEPLEPDNEGDEEDISPGEEEDEDDGRRRVYLTFDDGPSENTEKILDILDEYDVKATFFVVGREGDTAVSAYRRIVDEGHTLAMHSFTHQYTQIYKNLKSFKEDVTSIQDYLEEVTGVKPVFYRFPGGSSNSISKVSINKCIEWLNSQDIDYFDWNSMTGDASGNSYTVKKLISNAMEDVYKYNTCVVLMHDAADKDKTVEALPGLIKQLQKDDCLILPIDESTPLVQHVKSGRE